MRAERTSLLHQGMTAIGYTEELLISEFRRAPARPADVVELVGFGLEEPKDTSTAVVVADSFQQLGDRHLSNLFDAATDLAAPVALASDHETLRVFATATGEVVVTRPREHVSDLREYRATLGPRSLLEAKRGARQISLFPVPANALENARRSQRAALGAVIADLLRDLGAGSRILQLPTIPHFVDRQRLAYRAVGSALCAMVLADKTGDRGSTEQILSAARRNVASLFDWFDDENDPAHDMLLQSVEELSANIDFRKFDTNVLSRVYEEVLVDPDHRRELGIHYTPPAIAENLLRNLPIESIPPDGRYVLDPACGSGTLLVAAHDRLSNLQPAYWDTFKRHDYLRSRLRGRDRDPLAVELTRLALVLHAIPAGNGWEIEQGDSLDETRLQSSVVNRQIMPTIAVANPPFELPVNAGARLDIAVRFLDIILRQLAPGGLFGVILPASWLSGTGLTQGSRERVESTCEIFELWRLPRDTFSMSRASTVVLLGRKLHGKAAARKSASLIQRVTRVENLDEFFIGLDSGSQRSTGDPFDRSGPVTTGLAKVVGQVPISSVATTRTGAQPLPGHLEQTQAGLITDETVKWLPQLGRLPQFSIVPDAALLHTSWPAGFLRNIRARDVFSPKILLGTQATEEAPWVRVLIDRQGVLASKSLLWVVPNPDRLIARSLSATETLNALLYLCASSLFTAWLDEVSTGRNIRNSDLREFPVPRSENSWRLLSEAASTFIARVDQGGLDRNALQALDLVVAQAYGLPANDPIVLAARKRLEGVPDPALDGSPRYLFTPHSISPPAVEPIECEGIVNGVSESEILLDIEGVTPVGGSWTQIPARFPGYLCQPGRRFLVRLGDDDDLAVGDYRLPSGTWASTTELVELLQERHGVTERSV